MNQTPGIHMTERFLARFYITFYYLGTSNLKIKTYKILPHENLRTILRHTVCACRFVFCSGSLEIIGVYRRSALMLIVRDNTLIDNTVLQINIFVSAP